MARVVCDFYVTQAARALEIACDSRKRKSYRLNRPLDFHHTTPPFQLMVKVYVAFLQYVNLEMPLEPKTCPTYGFQFLSKICTLILGRYIF